MLHETFDRPQLDPRLAWMNPPPHWEIDPARPGLRVRPEANTDFWQRTHYGFQADSGHFLFARPGGDFVLTTHVRCRPAHQYDQAGLMVRYSPTCWLKTSVEHEPHGPSRLGAVVTRGGFSDWSTQDFVATAEGLWLRVRREGDDYTVESSGDESAWSQLRVAHLAPEPAEAALQCGLYACSPQGAGFEAEFGLLRIELAGER